MKRKLILSSIILIVTLIISNASFAAVEIIPSKSGDGKDAIVNTTVSNSYLLCQGMKDAGGTLKGTTVKPHLATNKDWGAVSYLSNSIYGTNTQGGNTGVTVTINGVNYYSTTTNITGVMNWGSNPNKEMYTQTAGLISNYDPGIAEVSGNFTELYNNKDTEFVEFINTKTNLDTKGMAILETRGLYGINFLIASRNEQPGSGRAGLFGGNFGSYYSGDVAKGNASSIITFRPVVWN